MDVYNMVDKENINFDFLAALQILLILLYHPDQDGSVKELLNDLIDKQIYNLEADNLQNIHINDTKIQLQNQF